MTSQIAKKKTSKPDIKAELNVTDLGERRSLALYKDGQILTLNIEQVSTYDKNPRIQKNAEYDSIYESIKSNGLENSLCVTQRPDDDPLSFFLIRGGNTRLAIIKELYRETGDKKYYEFSAHFKEWRSESVAVIGHLRENDARGDYVFIDRALGVRQAKTELQAEAGKKLSDRELVRTLKSHGYKINGKDLRRMNYAVDTLYLACPKLLSENIGPRKIDDIKKLDKKASELFTEIFPDSKPNEWDDDFSKVLTKQEKNYIAHEELFSYQNLYDSALDILSKSNHLTANRIAFLLDERINGSKAPQAFNPDLLVQDKPNTLNSSTFPSRPDNSEETSAVSAGVVKGDHLNELPTSTDIPTSITTDNNVNSSVEESINQSLEQNPLPNTEASPTNHSTAEEDCHYIFDNPSQHLEHSNWMYPEEANHNFSIFQDMPLTCKDRIEAAPLPDNADELREILFYKAFFFKHYMHVPSKVEKIKSGAGFTIDKIPNEQGMRIVFDNPKNIESRINKTTKHYIGWWLLLGFSDLLHQSLMGNFDIIKQYQPEGNLKDYLLTPKDDRLDTIDLVYNHQMAFSYLSELTPLFTSYASPKELQLFIEMTLIQNRLMRVTEHDIWGCGDE